MRSTEVTVHRSHEVKLGECCRLCLDIINFLNSERKVLNKGLILIICHCLFLHIFPLCPGYGSGFVSLHTDPDPTFIIQILIHKSGSGSASLITSIGIPRNFTNKLPETHVID